MALLRPQRARHLVERILKALPTSASLPNNFAHSSRVFPKLISNNKGHAKIQRGLLHLILLYISCYASPMLLTTSCSGGPKPIHYTLRHVNTRKDQDWIHQWLYRKRYLPTCWGCYSCVALKWYRQNYELTSLTIATGVVYYYQEYDIGEFHLLDMVLMALMVLSNWSGCFVSSMAC